MHFAYITVPDGSAALMPPSKVVESPSWGSCYVLFKYANAVYTLYWCVIDTTIIYTACCVSMRCTRFTWALYIKSYTPHVVFKYTNAVYTFYVCFIDKVIYTAALFYANWLCNKF